MVRKGMAEPRSRFRRAAKSEKQHSGDVGAPPPRPKQAVNLSVDAELLQLAREMKINLSQTLENNLERLTAKQRALRFYREHKASIDSYNRFVERNGTLAEAFYGPGAFDRDDSAI